MRRGRKRQFLPHPIRGSARPSPRVVVQYQTFAAADENAPAATGHIDRIDSRGAVQHRTYKDLRRLATVDKHAGLSPRSALAEQNAQKLKIAGYAGCADK